MSKIEGLNISSTSNITDYYGVDNLSSLKMLCLTHSQESYLPSDEWLPPTVQTLEVCSSKSLKSLPLSPNLSSLQQLIIQNCRELTSVVGIQNLNSLKELVIKDCPALQLSPNEYLPCSLQSLNVSDCKSLRSLPLLHHKMSAFDMLKLSNCSSLTDVCGLSDVPSLRYVIIWDCPEVLLSSEERLRITCPPQLELATGGLRPKQSDTMAPAKKIDATVGNKDQFLQRGLPMDYASNSLMELPLSTDINAEPQQT